MVIEPLDKDSHVPTFPIRQSWCDHAHLKAFRFTLGITPYDDYNADRGYTGVGMEAGLGSMAVEKSKTNITARTTGQTY